MEKKYFDCATNSSERNVVYDELTAENISKWFKESKGKFPVRIMGEDDFWAYIFKDKVSGDNLLVAYRWNRADDVESNRWTLRIGKTLTKKRWFAITRFIEDYLDGTLESCCGWNKNHIVRLA